MTKIRFALVLLGILATSSAIAAEETEARFIGNIRKGNYSLGGAVSFTQTWYDTSSNSSSFTFNPNAGYFISDRFNVGLSTAASFSTSGNFFEIGPFAKYYFLFLSDRTALNVQGEVDYYTSTGLGRSSGTLILNGSLGLDYFFNPQVSIGPRLTLSRAFASGGYVSLNAFCGLTFALAAK